MYRSLGQVEGQSKKLCLQGNGMPALKSSRPPKPNIRQVAQTAGVSVITASRAISGRGSVAEATRKRVLAVAERLKYRPNRLASAVLGGRSRTVGVMVPIGSWFQAQIIRGIHDTLSEQAYLPIVHFHGNGPTAVRDGDELAFLHRLIEHRVDGLIFFPSDESVTQNYLQEVWERGLPLVAVDRRLARTNAEFSGTDDVAGGRMVAEYLLSLGHRRIVHITGEHWVSTYFDRRRGFEEVIHGRADVTYRCVECAKSECEAIAKDILQAPDRPTAIFATSDNMAIRVYAAAAAAGLRIGSDLTVVGFADLMEAHGLRPRLTTVRQDAVAIGSNAARLLLDRLEDRVSSDEPRAIRLMPEFVIRDSCATVSST
jgi:DNA-binding LacI/PurR family transcriptional regulator